MRRPSSPVPPRSAQQVFDSHLALRKAHQLEEDIRTNYAPDVVLMTCTGAFHGHEGVRASAAELSRYLPDGQYTYRLRTVEGDVAFLVWSGRSPAGEVRDGADTFVIRDGKIIAQTIHYTVDRAGSPAAAAPSAPVLRETARRSDAQGAPGHQNGMPRPAGARMSKGTSTTGARGGSDSSKLPDGHGSSRKR